MAAYNGSEVTSTSVAISLKEKLFKCLEKLKGIMLLDDTFVLRVSNEKAGKALHLIFQLGRKHINFTEEEKSKFGNLLIDTIGLIQLSVECAAYYSSRLDTSLLTKRSALQFLIENFGQFPARNSTLKNELEKVNINGTISILQKIIDLLQDLSGSSDGGSDFESAGASDVPPSHTWWPTGYL